MWSQFGPECMYVMNERVGMYTPNEVLTHNFIINRVVAGDFISHT